MYTFFDLFNDLMNNDKFVHNFITIPSNSLNKNVEKKTVVKNNDSKIAPSRRISSFLVIFIWLTSFILFCIDLKFIKTRNGLYNHSNI